MSSAEEPVSDLLAASESFRRFRRNGFLEAEGFAHSGTG